MSTTSETAPTTTTFDDTLSQFKSSLAERQKDLTSVTAGAEVATEVFGPFFDILVQQINEQAEEIATFNARIAELKGTVAVTATASATALPSEPQIQGDFPTLDWILTNRKSRKSNKLTAHNIFTMWEHAKNHKAPAKGVWEKLDQKPWEALANDYKAATAIAVTPVASLAPAFYPNPQQMQYMQMMQAPQMPQMQMQMQQMPQIAPFPQLAAPAMPVEHPAEFLGTDGKLLKANSAYQYWLSKKMHESGGTTIKKGTWESVPPVEKAQCEQQFQRLKAYRSAIRA